MFDGLNSKKFFPFSSRFLSPWFTILFGGLLPFVSVIIEMYCVMSDIWMDEVNIYMSGLVHYVSVCAALVMERTEIKLFYPTITLERRIDKKYSSVSAVQSSSSIALLSLSIFFCILLPS